MARFLALLELFREGAVAFDQVTPLGELSVRWTGTDEGEIEVGDEYDEHAPRTNQPPAESVTDDDIATMLARRPTDHGDAVNDRRLARAHRRPRAARRRRPGALNVPSTSSSQRSRRS